MSTEAAPVVGGRHERPWPTHTTVLPFALFLVAAWCALAGQPWALPVLVLAGSYAAQTHLAYSVLVPGIAAIFLGPALAGRLQDEGIPFVTSNRVIGEQMGAGRYAAPDELVSGTRLRLRQGPEAPEEGERALLSWQSLTDEEQEELDELSSELAAAIGQHGVTPTTLGASILDMFGLEHIQAELHEWQNDPEALLASSRLWKMVRDDAGVETHRKLIDDSAYPPGLLDRWAELAERRDLANFTLYAVEIS